MTNYASHGGDHAGTVGGLPRIVPRASLGLLSAVHAVIRLAVTAAMAFFSEDYHFGARASIRELGAAPRDRCTHQRGGQAPINYFQILNSGVLQFDGSTEIRQSAIGTGSRVSPEPREEGKQR
jgi:hypothetical protein